MGVDLLVCDECERGFPDVIDFKYCECGRVWCDEECAELGGLDQVLDDDGYFGGISTCKFCRKEEATDSELLGAALYLMDNMSREELVRAYFELEDYEDNPKEDTGDEDIREG